MRSHAEGLQLGRIAGTLMMPVVSRVIMGALLNFCVSLIPHTSVVALGSFILFRALAYGLTLYSIDALFGRHYYRLADIVTGGRLYRFYPVTYK